MGHPLRHRTAHAFVDATLPRRHSELGVVAVEADREGSAGGVGVEKGGEGLEIRVGVTTEDQPAGRAIGLRVDVAGAALAGAAAVLDQLFVDALELRHEERRAALRIEFQVDAGGQRLGALACGREDERESEEAAHRAELNRIAPAR